MKEGEELFRGDQNEINIKPKMKTNEELQNEIHFAISRKPLSNIKKNGVYARVGKYMKIFSYLILLTGIGIIFTSCMGGYVASEPSYIDYARPQRQYDTQIWIDGDWGWNSQSHVYVQKAGYWDSPRPGHSYVKGSWQSTPRGKTWSKGYWQKQSRQQDNRDSRKQNNRDSRQQNNR